MVFVHYTLEDSINTFFSAAGASTTRSQCDEFAIQHCGRPIVPVAMQGVCSYTVAAGPSNDKVIQFREQDFLLDLDMLKLARKIHGDLIPQCAMLGHIGDADRKPLTIYEMNKLPGDTLLMTSSEFTHEQRLHTTNGLARCFARSWSQGISSNSNSVNKSTAREQCNSRLQYIAKTLPEQFLPAITEALKNLPAFFSEDYPLVLTHGDFNTTNILVDPPTGKITGIVDWSDASFQPFGFNLHLLDDLLGSMGPEGYTLVEKEQQLRSHFWSTLQEQCSLSDGQMIVAKLAARAGILLRYGTPFGAPFSGMIGCRDPDSDEVTYLDTFLLGHNRVVRT